MGLHLVTRHADVIQLVDVLPRSGIGIDAVALGLRHMAEQAGRELGWIDATANPILTALTVNATVPERRKALHRVAQEYADWTRDPEGVREVRAVWAWLAPHAPYELLAEIHAEVTYAADPDWNETCRKISRANLEVLLDRAVGVRQTLILRPGWDRNDDGPGAA
jgi:hypothetical protein